VNAVRNRFNASTGVAAISALAGGNVADPAVAIAYNDSLFERATEPACYRASGTASAAGAAPRFSIPISVGDLALAGLVPDDTTPPRFSVRAAIQIGSLINQTIDASVSGTSFLNGYWHVALRYAGAGASLAGPNDPATDVIFVGTAGTPASGIGIGSGDSVWDGSTGAQTLNSDEKILRRQNVPLRATYSGQALTGAILVFFGNAAAAGATSFDVARVALVPGATISESTAYNNTPEDAVFAVERRNLPAELVSKIDGAATETSTAARLTEMNGTNADAWALGMDQAWNFATGVRYGGAVDPADSHAAALWVEDQTGGRVRVAPNVLSRAEARGLTIQPARTELIASPRSFGSVYTTTGGTGTAVQNRRGPDGAANGAYTLTDSDGAAAYFRQRNLTVANDSLSHTAIVYIRKTRLAPSAYPSSQVGYAGGTGKSSRCTIDTVTGRTYVETPGDASWSVEDAGEFWKVSGTCANNNTGNTTFFHVLTPARAATFPAAGLVTAQGAHVFAWASIQKEAFSAADLPDGGSGGGNLVSVDQSAFSGAVAGLVTFDVRDPGASGVRLFSFDDGTVDNYVALEFVAGNTVLRVVSGTVEQAAVVLGQWRRGRQTVAFAAGANYAWAQFLRGDSVAADTSLTFPTVSKLGLGGNSTSAATRRANVVVEKVALRYGLADAETAAEMLDRAAIAHGLAPEFWDSFDRADNADLGAAPTGQTWAKLPGNGAARVTASIVGKTLVASDSGTSTTAAYSTVLLRQPAKRVRARVSFASGTSGGGAALILTKTLDTTSIVDWIVLDGSVHVVFNDTQVLVGLYLDNGSGVSDFFTLDTITYPTPMLRDGTSYEIGYDLDGNEITLFAPSMAPVKLQHPRFLALAGPYVTFQHY
jgi:hypothetical protein